jgi:Uncharacterized protein conserved in bacteria
MVALFAVLGYAFYRLRCEPAPLLLGFILGPMMEESLRRSSAAVAAATGAPSRSGRCRRACCWPQC